MPLNIIRICDCAAKETNVTCQFEIVYFYFLYLSKSNVFHFIVTAEYDSFTLAGINYTNDKNMFI